MSVDTVALSAHSQSRAPADEQVPLLGKKKKKPFYRARPLWLIPFAILTSLQRSLTVAPRVEVFTQLACAQIYQHQPSSLHDSFPVVVLDDQDDDPRRLPSSRCLSDPAVQSRSARLQSILTTTSGTLSALTSGYWGHFGQRRGRLTVMSVATFGLFMTDLTFILVSTPGSILSSHGHKLLILAPIIEGSLGGLAAVQAAMTAYLSDCTSPGSRATIFSRFTGAGYTAFSVGPIIGGYIIRSGIGTKPGQGKSVTAVFWTAVFCGLVNFILSLFVFPESLSKEKRAAFAEPDAKGKNRATQEPEASQQEDSPVPRNRRRGFTGQFFEPLAQLLPVTITDANGTKQKDWSLTLLGTSLFLYFLGTGIYQIKYYYAGHSFGWNAEQLGYYIAAMGGLRAGYLLLLLPFILAILKRKPSAANSVASSSSRPAKPKLTKAHLAREIRFDLLVARFSLFVDFLSNVLITLVPRYKVHDLASDSLHGQILFVLAGTLTSIGSGIVPAMQSLALCVLQARALISGATDAVGIAEGQVGKLLGALAVLQAVGQMILGPLAFGLIYSQTVAFYPEAIFVIAACILICAFTCIFFVANPLPRRSLKGKKPLRIDGEDDGELERGRSRVSKDLFGNPAH